MAGSNAFAFNGTAFVPTDRNSTAVISARATPSTFSSVTKAYRLSSGAAATQMWVGLPSAPGTPTFRNVRTGTFPNLANSIWVDWVYTPTAPVASFDIFAKIGAGSYSIVANVSAATRTYNYGNIAAGTTYSFYVRANAISGLTTTGAEASTILSAATSVGTLTTSKTTTSATAGWTVTAGVFQRFHIYDNASYLGEVLATALGTNYSFTRSSLAQNTSYNFRVYAQNYDGFWSSFSEANITTNTLPIPTVSWSDTSASKYSDWSITWSGTADITYQPQYYTSSWLDNGSTVSGSGSKTSSTQSVGYSGTLYMRVYVTDAYGASGYSNQVQVTAGRPLVTESSWKTGASTLYEYIVDANAPGWGNINALAFVCNSTQDYYFEGFPGASSSWKLEAYSLQSPSKELTRTDRRCRIKSPNTGTVRTQVFDGITSASTAYFGTTSEWHTSAGSGDVTYYFGVSDEPYFFNNGQNRYVNTSTGTVDNWNTGANTRFFVRVQATPRNYTTTTVQTQVNSTYA